MTRQSWADRMKNGRSNTDRPTVDADENQPDGSTVRQGLTPITENPPAAVNPYRGIERHGVPDGETPAMRAARLDEMPDEISVQEWTKPHADMDPIPVHVVNTSSDEFRAFRTMQFSVTGTTVQMLGRDRLRRKAFIRNFDGASYLCVGPSVDVNRRNSYLLGYGESLTVESTEPIYVVAFDGVGPINVLVYQEYMVDPGDQTSGLRKMEPHSMPHPPPLFG